MKVFFDNCTSHVLASTLHGYVDHLGHAAVHIKDLQGLPDGRRSTDLQWIALLRSQGDWIFVTGDMRVLKNRPERDALRSAGLHGFVLAPAYQRTPMHQLAATLVWKWPEIEAVTRLVATPSMHQIPVGRSSKLRALPL